MSRGLIASLVILLTTSAVSLAQPLVPNQANPALPILPGQAADVPPEPPTSPNPEIGPYVSPAGNPFGPSNTQEGSAYPYLWWVKAEYLRWWIKNGPAAPPLVTTGPATDALPAVLGQPGTQVLAGGRPFDYGTLQGGRFTLGGWCDCELHNGVEFTGFFIDPQPNQQLIFSGPNGTPILGRPFTAVPTGGPTVDYVSFPNRFAGSVSVISHSGLWGYEILGVRNLVPWREFAPASKWGGVYRVDGLYGFRYLDLLEDLSVNQNSAILSQGVANFLGPEVFSPNIILVSDRFTTRNQFYGGEIGARAEFVWGACFLDVVGKLAVGGTQQTVSAFGVSTLIQPVTFTNGTTTVSANTNAGGLLATATNIGRRSGGRFSVIPELGFNLGYQLFHQVRIFAGYSFLYWGTVVRPGNQIDPVVNVTQVPINPSFGPLTGPVHPAPLFQESGGFWAQGVNIGFEVRF